MVKASVLILAALLLSGCSETPPNKLKDGKALYDYYCKACHAKEGPGAYFARLDTSKPRLSSTDILMMLTAQQFMSNNPHPRLQLPKLTDQQINALARFTLEQRILKGKQLNK